MWEILAGLLVGTAASGVIPLVNAELLVIGVVVAAPEIGIPLVALVSTTGQMSTKVALFGVARWAPGRLKGKARAALDRASGAVAARGGAASSLVFASAFTGVPPFYGTSLAAGALGMRLQSFLLSGGAGRLVRFALIAWAARYVGDGAMHMFVAPASAEAPVGGLP
jgi:membrane protein YqaA with SNARE-associated domain